MIEQNKRAKVLAEALEASLRPCANNAAWGRGECAAAPTVDETGCASARPDRTVQKLILGDIEQVTTFANCTTLVVSTDGTAYLNGKLYGRSTFSTQVMDPTTGAMITYTTTPYDLAESIDARAGHYGGYGADGEDRDAITALVFSDALLGAYGKSEARANAQKAAECQKSFLCRNSEWISLGVGIALAIGCGALTAGAAAAACFIVAGATTNVAKDAMQNNIHSFTDVIASAAKGGSTGLLDAATGGVGGKLAGLVVKEAATRAGAKLVSAASGAIAGGVSSALYDLATTGSVNLANLAMGVGFGAAGGLAFRKAGCLGHSFAAGTLVLMADGTTKAIEDIKVGDKVTATDPDTGKTTAQPVTALHLNRDTDLTDVAVVVPADHDGADAERASEGHGGRSTRGPTSTATIKTTEHHPFWDATSGTWTDAARLVAGRSTLLTPDGQTLLVSAVRNHSGDQNMHDLTVATIHTYYVLAGNIPVVVHNCGGEDFTDLYHGTSADGAANIYANGVDTSYSSRPMDFGNGFYTTRDPAQAAAWAARRFGNNGVVLHFRVPTAQLRAMNSQVFSGDSPALRAFVRYYRGGGTGTPFDSVEGPMLGNPSAFMRGQAPRWFGNQVAFFGDTGPILDAGLQ
jgi:hypothetical protein